MHVQPDVVVSTQPPFAGVDTNPHANRCVGRPFLGCQLYLDLRRGAHGLERTVEDGKERVPLRTDLDASMPGDC